MKTLLRSFVLHFAACISIVQTHAQSPSDSATLSEATAHRLYDQFKKDLSTFEGTHGHYIQTPNARIHYLTWGKPSGIPLVWSHGTYSNAYELFGFADSFAAAGYYVIAIDYYGHGLTPIPDHEVSLFHVADDIRFLLDALKIRKAVIGGFSRGGSISTAFYDAYPDRVKALILEDGGSVAWDVNGHKKPVDSLAKEFAQNYKDRTPSRGFDSAFDFFRILYSRIGTKPTFLARWYVWANMIKQDSVGRWRSNPGVDDLVCERTAEQLLTAVHRPYAESNLFGASTHLIYPKIIYRNLNVPMLILDPVSDQDWFDFKEENARLQKSHPDLIVHKVYEQTGHGVKNDRPAEFCRDVLSFLGGIKK